MTTETFYRSERGHTVEDGVFLLAYTWTGELPCSPGQVSYHARRALMSKRWYRRKQGDNRDGASYFQLPTRLGSP
jgi:hypothetical protein